jgi:hypothetical protein
MTLLRTDSFVPLTTLPAADEDREFHVTVIPRTVATRPLQTLQTGPAGEASVSAVPGREPAAVKVCEPRVSLQCEGDRITNIRVQCSCGQVVDLACVYESPAHPG